MHENRIHWWKKRYPKLKRYISKDHNIIMVIYKTLAYLGTVIKFRFELTKLFIFTEIKIFVQINWLK